MNTSYQSLQSVFTQFTRAAAAAERVFSLMDSLPDIDTGLPAAGLPTAEVDACFSAGSTATLGASGLPAGDGAGGAAGVAAEQGDGARGTAHAARTSLSEVRDPLDLRKSARGELELRDVRFYYQMRPDRVVLDGVSLHIPAGTVCALVGRSGGGKSTIVHLLQRFYDVKGGAVLFDGHDVRRYDVRELRGQVSGVFSFFFSSLFSFFFVK